MSWPNTLWTAKVPIIDASIGVTGGHGSGTRHKCNEWVATEGSTGPTSFTIEVEVSWLPEVVSFLRPKKLHNFIGSKFRDPTSRQRKLVNEFVYSWYGPLSRMEASSKETHYRPRQGH